MPIAPDTDLLIRRVPAMMGARPIGRFRIDHAAGRLMRYRRPNAQSGRA